MQPSKSKSNQICEHLLKPLLDGYNIYNVKKAALQNRTNIYMQLVINMNCLIMTVLVRNAPYIKKGQFPKALCSVTHVSVSIILLSLCKEWNCQYLTFIPGADEVVCPYLIKCHSLLT